MVFSFVGYEEMLGEEYQYPEWSIKVGWLVTCSSILWIPVYIIYKFMYATNGSCKQRWQGSFYPVVLDNGAISAQDGATNV